MMRRILKWIGIALAVVVVAALAVAFWKRDDIARLMAVNTLFTEDKIVGNFSNMQGAFHSAAMDKGPGPVSPLPASPRPLALSPDMEAWIDDHDVTALVVLDGTEVMFEGYYLGTQAEDLRISWSVAKSFLSALLGVVVADGDIAALTDPVTKYAPALAGSAYDGVTVEDVLTMSSGVAFDEDYLDYDSDINKMGRTLALGGSMDDFAASLTTRFTTPGTQFQYVSIDTHVLGMVIRGATGRSVPDLLQEKIITPLGLEADPYYVTDGHGVAFVLGGLNLRTRDYARFGAMIANEGRWQGIQVVPEGWIETATTAQANTMPGRTQYGYQWWIPQGFSGAEVLARGVYDQFIYIDRDRDIVIAINSAHRGFREPGVQARNEAMMQTIADAVANR